MSANGRGTWSPRLTAAAFFNHFAQFVEDFIPVEKFTVFGLRSPALELCLELVERLITFPFLALKQAERLMSAAEKSGDQEAIDCLQPKVVALRSLGQVATAASASVPGLIASGNTSMLDSTMRQVAVLDSRADGLLVESQGCVAGNSDALGTDNLSVEGDALADQELNTDVPETLTWTDPPEASPFL